MNLLTFFPDALIWSKRIVFGVNKLRCETQLHKSLTLPVDRVSSSVLVIEMIGLNQCMTQALVWVMVEFKSHLLLCG